ncbi:hypothetical protein O181_047136 [Austropuccinia psidii MF-1]|uniref:Uncharacterized protein n=1 Tax=Austropuccinia psidii MF-1 TaxID=1389203 RepID=A0A9Q3DN90_9BASI|nr:hypothetical protein [Austropuccinia psidii MF-1]
MSSKLMELTESSPSALPPSFLHGSGIVSQFSSPSMASSGDLNPTQIYDSYKEVEVLDHACNECLAKRKDFFEHYNPRSTKCHYCFIGKKACHNTVGGRPIYSSLEVPIFRIHTEGIVKRIRQIANTPPDLDAEGSDELYGEEVEVVPNSASHPSNNSPSQPPVKRFQGHVIPSTPRNFQPTLATIPTSIWSG